MSGGAERVSVVIPAYNAAAIVSESVESALAIDWPDVEVIVVDDGSADDTLKVLERFGDRIVVVAAEHGGLRHARDEGHRAATGEFIAWLDADDLAEPHRIEVQVAVMRRFPDVALVSSDFTTFTADGPYDEHARTYYSRLADPDALDRIYEARAKVETGDDEWDIYVGSVRDELPFGNFVHPPTVMVRRSAIASVDARESTGPMSDDWLLLGQLAMTGDFAFVDAPLLRYRKHADQVSAPKDRVRQTTDMLQASKRQLAERPDLMLRFPGRCRSLVAGHYANVADAMSDQPGLGALGYVGRSVRQGGLAWEHLRIVGRTLTPRFVLDGYRSVRGGRAAPASPG